MKKIFLTIILILTYSSINAQISTSINSVFLNSQTSVSNCNTLDFGATQNNSLSINFKLTRPSSLPDGTGTLRIMLKYDSTSNPQQIGASQDILNSFWTNSMFESSIGGNISDSQVQLSGSSIYLEFETFSNVKTSSCQYPITKTQTPTFTLSPSSLSISCGSVAPVTFTYSNVYNTPGVTYNYSYSGWTFVSQTPNSITLKPTNGDVLPSNFSLVPIVNGVSQPYKVCTVTRSPFTTTSQITGGGVVCPGGTATFNLTDSGSFTNVSWSIAEFDVAAIQNSTNSSITVEALTSGTFTIKAIVQNACGQTQTVTRTLNIGVPNVNPFYNTISGLYDWYATNYSPFQIGVYPVENATSYIWTITGSSSPSNCTNRPKFSNGSATMTTPNNYVTINTGSCLGNYVVSCRPANSCGQSFGIQSRGFAVGNNSDSDNPCDNDPIPMGLKMKNPIKENDEIVLNIHHGDLPCNTSNLLKNNQKITDEGVEKINYSIEIYDFYGRKLISKKINAGDVTISDTNLSKGKYIINISNDLGDVKREILIVE